MVHNMLGSDRFICCPFLQGTIPKELGSLTKLDGLGLEGNQLSGEAWKNHLES